MVGVCLRVRSVASRSVLSLSYQRVCKSISFLLLFFAHKTRIFQRRAQKWAPGKSNPLNYVTFKLSSVSKSDRQSSSGRPIDGGDALVDPRNGHRMVAQMNVYRGNSLHRHGSVGVSSPSMFHVNSSAGPEFYSGHHMQSVINPRIGT